MQSLGGFVQLPENQSAVRAIDALAKGQELQLLLHGPPGSGKSHLALGFVDEFTQTHPTRTAQIQTSAELGRNLIMPPLDRRPFVIEVIGCDLLILEDLQHLHADAGDELAYILDRRQARQRATLMTAVRGPAEIEMAGRLRSRLVGGLVVGIAPLSSLSRLQLAREWCRAKRVQVTDEVIAWLARDPGGARPILGNIALLEVLAKRFRPPLTMKVVETELAGSKSPRPSVLDELLATVANRFQVSVKALLGPSRVRDVVLPRQIAMYIARSAGFSFPEIAAFFGGRDHTTVMHACEKLAALIEIDATLANHVRELQTMTSFRAPSS